ncbi:MAG TPA: hypothetical protein VGH13_21745 [Xanthobacteraceae bacterium]|jgi:hypothetical protein
MTTPKKPVHHFDSSAGEKEGCVPRRRRLISLEDTWNRLRCKKSKFYEDFVATGRLRLVHIGPQKRAAVEDEVDDLVEELIAARDAKAGGGGQ